MTARADAAEGVCYPLGMSRSLRLAVARAIQRRRQKRARLQQWATIESLLSEINLPSVEV